jgi:type II secretory pathway pseudopilin PulG
MDDSRARAAAQRLARRAMQTYRTMQNTYRYNDVLHVSQSDLEAAIFEDVKRDLFMERLETLRALGEHIDREKLAIVAQIVQLGAQE